MRELAETTAVAFLAFMGKVCALATTLCEVHRPLWELIGLLPVLLACVVKVRETPGDDDSEYADEVEPTYESEVARPPQDATAPVAEVARPSQDATAPVAEVARPPQDATAPVVEVARPPQMTDKTPASSAANPTLPTATNPSPILDESTVRSTLLACGSIINTTNAAHALGVSRRVLWSYIQAKPELLILIEAGRQAMLQRADRLLIDSIHAHEPWAAEFMLLTKGKSTLGPLEAPSSRPVVLVAEQPGCEFAKRLDRAGDKVRSTISQHAGDLRYAAQKLGVNSAELLDYLLLRPELQTDLGDAREELLDHAETKLRAAVDDLQPWAICFVLLTLGRDFGYVKSPNHRSRGSEPRRVKKPKASEPSRAEPDRLEGVRRTEAKLRAEIGCSKRWVIRFLLTRLGKSRGYEKPSRRHPAEVAPSSPTPVGVRDLSRLSPAERTEYEQLRAKMRGTPGRSGEPSPTGLTIADASPSGRAAVELSPTNPNASPNGSSAGLTIMVASPSGRTAAKLSPTNPNASPSGSSAGLGSAGLPCSPNRSSQSSKSNVMASKPAASKPSHLFEPVWEDFLGGVYSKLRPTRNRKMRRRRKCAR